MSFNLERVLIGILTLRKAVYNHGVNSLLHELIYFSTFPVRIDPFLGKDPYKNHCKGYFVFIFNMEDFNIHEK